MVCNENEHSFHFIDLEGKNEHYVEKDICKVKPRLVRFATFLCDKCGLLNRVEIINE